jgi:hypothetical protein
MTNGTKIVDNTSGYQTGRNLYDYAGNFTEYIAGATVPVGYKLTKTWNGTDSPHRKPPMETYTWREPDRKIVVRIKKGVYRTFVKRGVLHTRKRRTDTRKRRLTDDHPYYTTITEVNDTPFQTRDFSFGKISQELFTTNAQAFGSGLVGMHPSEWDTDDELRLIAKLQSRVAGSDFNAGVFLGEGRMALKMIADTAIKLRRAYSAVRKLQFTHAAEILVKDTTRKARLPKKGRAQGSVRTMARTAVWMVAFAQRCS